MVVGGLVLFSENPAYNQVIIRHFLCKGRSSLKQHQTHLLSSVYQTAARKPKTTYQRVGWEGPCCES